MPSSVIAPLRRVLVPVAIGGPPLGPFGADATVVALDGRSMGTTWRVLLSVHDRDAAAGHRAAIDALLDALVADLSNWSPTSALSRFNAAPLGTWCALPRALVDVLDAARDVFMRSGGAFDPTVGRAVARWGFGPPSDAVPDREAADFATVDVDVDAARARRRADVSIDLCGIAKGYAVDRVSRLLHERGAPHHLVEIGGELRGAGVKPDAMPWWVALEQPPDLDDDEPTIAALHGLSIATSGDYRRFVERGGRRLTHTIDPRAGRPVAEAPAAVTVLHADCLHADAHATAVTVLGAEAGLAYATAHGLAARIVSRGPGRRSTIRRTPAFDAMLA